MFVLSLLLDIYRCLFVKYRGIMQLIVNILISKYFNMKESCSNDVNNDNERVGVFTLIAPVNTFRNVFIAEKLLM